MAVVRVQQPAQHTRQYLIAFENETRNRKVFDDEAKTLCHLRTCGSALINSSGGKGKVEKRRFVFEMSSLQ